MSSGHPEGAASPDEPAAPVPDAGARTALYVPRILQQHLVSDPGTQSWIAEGTAAFADISGFTKLSEQLASKGREGAEQITEVIGKSFEAILSVAYDAGGSLLKFGGDALLLWFEDDGHLARACQATIEMRAKLGIVGRPLRGALTGSILECLRKASAPGPAPRIVDFVRRRAGLDLDHRAMMLGQAASPAACETSAPQAASSAVTQAGRATWLVVAAGPVRRQLRSRRDVHRGPAGQPIQGVTARSASEHRMAWWSLL